jgi:hypothetical protein
LISSSAMLTPSSWLDPNCFCNPVCEPMTPISIVPLRAVLDAEPPALAAELPAVVELPELDFDELHPATAPTSNAADRSADMLRLPYDLCLILLLLGLPIWASRAVRAPRSVYETQP